MSETKSSTVKELDKKKFRFTKLTADIKLDELPINGLDKHDQDPQEVHNFIHKEAWSHQKNNLGVTRLVYYDGVLVGYITISNYSFSISRVKKEKRPETNLKHLSYPAIIIAYLAVDKDQRDNDYGSYILKWAKGFGQVTARKVGCRYLVLFTRDSVGFYLKNNFIMSEGQEGEEFKMMFRHLFDTKGVAVKSTT